MDAFKPAMNAPTGPEGVKFACIISAANLKKPK